MHYGIANRLPGIYYSQSVLDLGERYGRLQPSRSISHTTPVAAHVRQDEICR
jgi:hypothetical protein